MRRGLRRQGRAQPGTALQPPWVARYLVDRPQRPEWSRLCRCGAHTPPRHGLAILPIWPRSYAMNASRVVEASCARSPCVDQRTPQLIEQQRASVQADEPLVVEVDQQAARGGAEEHVGIGDSWRHRDQRARISPSSSSPSLLRARRWLACPRRCQASTADLSTRRWFPTC